MKLLNDTKAAAETRADEMHQWLITNNPLYAESVHLGYTLRWAIPAQEVDKDGKIIDAAWSVPVDERVIGALRTDERAKIPEIKAMDAAVIQLENQSEEFANDPTISPGS